MGDVLSTDSRPQLYEGISLLLAHPGRQFPEEFNPEWPFAVTKIKRASRKSFINTVEKEEGLYVVPVEEFVQTSNVVELFEAPEDVELRDGGIYIVVPDEELQATRIKVSFFCQIVLYFVDFQINADLRSDLGGKNFICA